MTALGRTAVTRCASMNMPGRSSRDSLGTRAFTSTVRPGSSTTGSTKSTTPANGRPGGAATLNFTIWPRWMPSAKRSAPCPAARWGVPAGKRTGRGVGWGVGGGGGGGGVGGGAGGGGVGAGGGRGGGAVRPGGGRGGGPPLRGAGRTVRRRGRQPLLWMEPSCRRRAARRRERACEYGTRWILSWLEETPAENQLDPGECESRGVARLNELRLRFGGVGLRLNQIENGGPSCPVATLLHAEVFAGGTRPVGQERGAGPGGGVTVVGGRHILLHATIHVLPDRVRHLRVHPRLRQRHLPAGSVPQGGGGARGQPRS